MYDDEIETDKRDRILEEKKQTAIIIENQFALRVMGDRVAVLEDKWKSGLECKTCDGNMITDEDCPACKGTGIFGSKDSSRECPACMVGELRRASGKKVCPDCQGRGALIVAPQTSERRTTTGKVVSVGPKCTLYKLGEHVIYGSYAGQDIKFKHRNTVRILHEDEIMAKINLLNPDFNFDKAVG